MRTTSIAVPKSIIDLPHNYSCDPEKNRENASAGQKIWPEPHESRLSVRRNKRWCSCGLCISACRCAGLPIFQLRVPSTCLSGQSGRYRFFLRFVTLAESVAFFVGEGSRTQPRCAAEHSSFYRDSICSCCDPGNFSAVSHFYFGADLISVISVQAFFFYLN